MSREAPKRQRNVPRSSEGDNPSSPDGKNAPSSAKKAPPWEKEAENDSASFGTWLRRQREAREISLRDIAERTKIGIRYLEALEEDRLDVLPAPVFTKGFLREYAQYIGLSPDEAINHYLSFLSSRGGPDANDPGELTRARPRQASSGRWTFVVFLVVTALLLAALVLFSRQAEKRREAPDSLEERPPMAAPPAAVAPAEPTPPPAPTPAVPQNAPLQVDLELSGTCWVRRSIDGGGAIAETRGQGQSLRIEAQREVVLTLGNAGAVKILVNGRPFPLAQGAGEVVTDLKIDLESAKTLQPAREAG